ncbi:MAG: hypothetical protein AAGF12_37015 [Myxococcota bacterium]
MDNELFRASNELRMQAVPPHLMDSIHAYAQMGRPTGGFLRAVLEHDLFEAHARGDAICVVNLHAIVLYIHNHLPGGCHGSPDRVDAWIRRGGLGGRES